MFQIERFYDLIKNKTPNEINFFFNNEHVVKNVNHILFVVKGKIKLINENFPNRTFLLCN